MDSNDPPHAAEELQDNEILLDLSNETGASPEAVGRIVELVKAHYSAPIPPAAELERLNSLEPGLGTKIVEDYLVQRKHERQSDVKSLDLAKLESDRHDGWLRYAGRGQNIGATLYLISLIAAVTAMWFHNTAAAIAFFSPSIFGAITKFVEPRGTPEDKPRARKD